MNYTRHHRFKTVVHLPTVPLRRELPPVEKPKPTAKAKPKRTPLQFVSFKLSQATLAHDFLHAHHKPVPQLRLSSLRLPSLRTQSDRIVKPKAVIPKEISLDVAEETTCDIASLACMKKYDQRKGYRYISHSEDSKGYMINEYSLPNALVPYRCPKKQDSTRRRRRGLSFFDEEEEALLQHSNFLPERLSY